jgi:hypothetical protein
MNFKDYKVPMDYPSKSAFQTKYWYNRGVLCWQQNPGDKVPVRKQTLGPDLKHCVVETVVDEQAFKAAREKYATLEREMYERFKHDLFKDLDIEQHPMRELLYSKAWSEGHAAGLQDVYDCALDLVDFLTPPEGSILVSKEKVVYPTKALRSRNALRIESLVAELQELL